MKHRTLVYVQKNCPKKHAKAMERVASMYRWHLDTFCMPQGTKIYLKYWKSVKWKQETDFNSSQYDVFTVRIGRLSLYAPESDIRSTVRHELSHMLMHPLTSLANALARKGHADILGDAEETVVTRIERTMAAMSGEEDAVPYHHGKYDAFTGKGKK